MRGGIATDMGKLLHREKGAYSLGEAGSVKFSAWEVLKMKIRPPAA